MRKRSMMILILFLLISLPVSAAESELPQLHIGDAAPKLVSFDIYGATINSDDLFGDKLLLISFFGTYCEPCIAEFPDLIKLYKEYKDHLTVIMVNKGREDREQLKQFQNEHNLNNFSIVRDRFGKIGDPFGVKFVPVTLLIDKNGKILYVQYGAFKEGELYKTLTPIIRSGTNE